MDLKVLMIILVYYMSISTVFLMAGPSLGLSNTYTMNSSSLGGNYSQYAESGGFLGSGVSFAQFAGLVTVGIGLGGDTPSWVQSLFSLWSISWLLFTIGFVVSSIWNG